MTYTNSCISINLYCRVKKKSQPDIHTDGPHATIDNHNNFQLQNIPLCSSNMENEDNSLPRIIYRSREYQVNRNDREKRNGHVCDHHRQNDLSSTGRFRQDTFFGRMKGLRRTKKSLSIPR